jgi:GT2 family glycosyltransferase/SAM-dependent methyltransferase
MGFDGKEEVMALPEDDVRCPLCQAHGDFFRSFDERRLFRCSNCASLFFVPLLPPHPYGASSSWQGCKLHVERYANLTFHAEIISTLREMIGKRGNGGGSATVDLLEIGCNYGFFLDMAEFLTDWKVIGIDPQLCARMGAVDLGVNILKGTIQEIAIERRFDVVVANQIIEHNHDLPGFLKPISGLLKPGGLVLVITPDASLNDLGADYSPLSHTVLLSPQGLERFLSEGGLTHQHFFKFSFPNQIAVVASEKALADELSTPTNSSGMGDWLRMTRAYLEARTRAGGLPTSLGVGLNFRLFELLVNLGEYRQAQEVLSALEDSMGTNRFLSQEEFVKRHVEQMLEQTVLFNYAGAGPCCMAPYLYYKGILNLNYTGNSLAALNCFTYSQRLFEHEVDTLGLVQFKEWAALAKTHAAIAQNRLPPGTLRDRGRMADRSVCAPLFLQKGIDDPANDLLPGKLRRLDVAGNQSFVFQFRCTANEFSGAAFDLLITTSQRLKSVGITLSVFEEFNPVELRKVTLAADIGSQGSLRGRTRFVHPFTFGPIPDSRGKTYTLVISLCDQITRASLLCTRVKGMVTIAWGRRYRRTQPVMVPYHKFYTPRWSDFSKETAPLVSCLLVTHNSEDYIRLCLDSILRQDYPNIEIVVIDNHSSDKTVETICTHYSQATIRALEANLHFCRGANIGVALCKGEFIYVINPDTVLEPGIVRQLVEHIQLSPHIGVAGSNIYTKGSLVRYADVFFIHGVIGSSEMHLKSHTFSAAPCGAGFLIRRAVIEELGELFDEKFMANWEDHDLGLRCWLHGHACLHIPYLGVYHYGGGAYGLVNPKRDVSVIRNSLLTYFKNLSLGGFLNAFFRTALHCRNPYRLWGLLLFLGGLCTFIPKRAAIRKRTRIKDQLLKFITSGIIAIAPSTSKETQPHEPPF